MQQAHDYAETLITKPKLERLALPLPPPTEQRAVLERVDELFGLCAQLEEELASIHDCRARLLRASTAYSVRVADGGDVGLKP
jgi:type I restriction enzyme, S subunit